MASTLSRFKGFISRNIVLVVCIPGIAGIHWTWQYIQQQKVFVAEHERREFPPITLFRHAKHLVGLGPEPEKHPPP